MLKRKKEKKHIPAKKRLRKGKDTGPEFNALHPHTLER